MDISDGGSTDLGEYYFVPDYDNGVYYTDVDDGSDNGGLGGSFDYGGDIGGSYGDYGDGDDEPQMYFHEIKTTTTLAPAYDYLFAQTGLIPNRFGPRPKKPKPVKQKFNAQALKAAYAQMLKNAKPKHPHKKWDTIGNNLDGESGDNDKRIQSVGRSDSKRSHRSRLLNKRSSSGGGGVEEINNSGELLDLFSGINLSDFKEFVLSEHSSDIGKTYDEDGTSRQQHNDEIASSSRQEVPTNILRNRIVVPKDHIHVYRGKPLPSVVGLLDRRAPDLFRFNSFVKISLSSFNIVSTGSLGKITSNKVQSKYASLSDPF